MGIILQITIIAGAGLIAYWWANQGFFSSLLHFLCVVAAGAITFAFWEPLVVNVLLNDKWYDNYVWGVSFIVLFIVSLAAFRFAFDKLAPANVDLSHGTNLIFGGIFGLGSGILTTGMLIIGIGFIQSTTPLAWSTGWARGTETIEEQTHLWVPVHTWTTDFYGFLSAGSLYPSFTRKPLAQMRPDLDKLAFSLIRDSYKDGLARVSIPPDSVTVNAAWYAADRALIELTFSKAAFDHARQFIMSASQIRLLAYRGGTRSGAVSVGHPWRWGQYVLATRNNPAGTGDAREPWRTFDFDERSHYITSMSGQSAVKIMIMFQAGSGGEYGQYDRGSTPLYVEIKGLRFALPWVEQLTTPAINSQLLSGPTTNEEPPPPLGPNVPVAGSQDIRITDSIRPLEISQNSMGGMVANENRMLVSGSNEFNKGRAGNRQTRIKGIAATEGAKIVQVNVSRSSTCSLYSSARNESGEEAAPILVDDVGRKYYAIGYMLDKSADSKIAIHLEPNRPITALIDLPHLPTSNTQTLKLIYEVTVGVVIKSFRFGDVGVARCDIPVTNQ